MTAHTDMSRLWLRSQGIPPEEAALGIFKAHAGDSNAYHIIWGAGHEGDPRVKAREVLGAYESCVPLLTPPSYQI